MAKYTVERACGHEETIQLYGKMSKRRWRLENVENQKLCEKCYTEKQAEENAEAAAANANHDLPELQGTEKQIPWAESIRKEILIDSERNVQFMRDEIQKAKDNGLGGDTQRAEELLDAICKHTSASWWIDHRHKNDVVGLIRTADRELKAEQS